DEGTEVDDAPHRPGVHAANLGLRRQALDDVERAPDRRRIAAGHRHGAVVVDVDRAARLLDDAFDRLAAGPDDDADLVRLDLDGRDARRPLVDLRPGRRQRLEHLAEDVQPPFLGLRERLLQNRALEALDLDVHLDRGDAALGAAHLEVHVAQVILVAEDVAQDGDALSLGDEAHGDAGHRPLDRHAAVHEAEGPAAHAGHGARTVRLQDLADHPDRVREVVVRGDHAGQSALGQRTVADLTPPRAAQRLRLAGREGREVVVQHEALPRLADQRVDLLLVTGGAERGRDDRLRLAALEQRRAVRARQEPDLAGDGTNGGGLAAVDPAPLIEHHLAHDEGLAPLELALDELLELLVALFPELPEQGLGQALFDDGVAFV